MYALAASNMLLRGDGKANLYQGSCFDQAIVDAVKKHHCNIGMINPPYSQSDEDLHELMFVKQMLDLLEKGGIGIAIIPMSCAISPHPLKEELLKHHTLDAVMSMPDELFYPVGTVTCIMIFKAKIPHRVSNKKTWFGYWKDDGFSKNKIKGRNDENYLWNDIKKRWVENYRNKEDIPGESVKQKVKSSDEWCAEAYMETDYTGITKSNFKKTVRDYAIFKLLRNSL
jgi:type I restriction-modification system DNA methylase subunit